MKKLFLFATVAAAGLFAGCSSSDDAISDGGNPAIENVDGDRAAIKIGIGNMANSTTRGTGTVGGVGTTIANVWKGQTIYVSMFDKGTLDLAVEDPNAATPVELYNDREMITPGTDANLIDGMDALNLASGEAMNADGSIKYYPVNGNFDFFGYHIDDAGTEAVDKTTSATKWTVKFEIDGSQDLMSTKAELTAEYDNSDPQNPVLNGGQWKEIYDNYASYKTIDGKSLVLDAGDVDATHALWTDFDRYYSAYSARKTIHPTLTFNHLLTRLNFKIKAGNDASAGSGDDYVVATYKPKAEITDAEYAAYAAGTSNGVKAAIELWEDLDPTDGKYTAIDAATITKAQYDDDAFRAADKELFEENTYTAGQNTERAVKVEKIEVQSKTTGKMLVAWTADELPANETTMPAYKKIVWDEAPAELPWLALKERPAKKLIAANNPVVPSDIQGINADDIITTLQGELEALNNELSDLQDDDPQDPVAIANKQTEIAAKVAEIAATQEKITTHSTPTLSTVLFNELKDSGKAKYDDVDPDKVDNELLTTLSPTSPNFDSSKGLTDPLRYPLTPIGEALIVAPNATTDGVDYTAEPLKMKITLSQKVPVNWNTPRQYEKLTRDYTLDIPVPKENGVPTAFKINNSYNVVLTVYGYSRIEVKTVITEWENGEELPVGQD